MPRARSWRWVCCSARGWAAPRHPRRRPRRPLSPREVGPGQTVGLGVPRAGPEKGFCAQEGLELEFTRVARGASRLAAVVSGDAQILLGSAEDLIRARDQGLDLPIVAAILNAITYNI